MIRKNKYNNTNQLSKVYKDRKKYRMGREKNYKQQQQNQLKRYK